jgi:F-type H+-transporting ATPase subunit b
MQTLDIISVNLWQILISLLNLYILFLIIKKFLYKPVKNVMAQRQAQIDADFAAAALDKQTAAQDRAELQRQLSGAREKADALIAEATLAADQRGEKIVEEAKLRADGIVRRAQADAAQELKRAEATIKQEIVEVSGALAEKLLEREINQQDHRALIDSFIEEIGDENG